MELIRKTVCSSFIRSSATNNSFLWHQQSWPESIVQSLSGFELSLCWVFCCNSETGTFAPNTSSSDGIQAKCSCKSGCQGFSHFLLLLHLRYFPCHVTPFLCWLCVQFLMDYCKVWHILLAFLQKFIHFKCKELAIDVSYFLDPSGPSSSILPL